MDIEIRRNGDLNISFELSKEQRKSLLDLLKPKVVDERVEEMLNENNRLKRGICEKIMAYCMKTGQRDLDGNLITPETHEVDCVVDFTNYNGEQWAYPKQWYVRPKKSEYEK